MDESVSPALTDMLENGVLVSLDSGALEEFSRSEGLKLLFFTGGPRRVRESHDVAVALREILKSWPGAVNAGVRDWADYEAAFQRYLGAPQDQARAS